MSLNTGNLVTTVNGQAALADVHNINAQLHADHREITIKLLFPYMAISNKTTAEINAITGTNDQQIREERCFAPVDICQVQSYSVDNEAKRDFAIGGLFDVKTSITDARTVILFCKTYIVDARSASKKRADANRSAADIVENEYGYVTVQLPFAYTQLLNSSGEAPDGGITVGASRYGRSRHRFYFNYIIDNNSGIADNITVDDNVYPYSDGYLSKTAFEAGLKRYEEAVAKYQAEYEKYANGHKAYYDTMSDAIKWASPQHKFLLVNNEAENTTFPVVDIQAENQYWNLAEFPPSSSQAWSGIDSYGDYTPEQYGPAYGNDGDRALYDRAMKFEYRDVREVEFTRTGEKKNMPVLFQFLFYTRTSLPASLKSSFVSVYHVLRFTMQYVIEDTQMLAEGEILYTDNTIGFVPSCPSVGKIYIDGTMPSFSLLTEELLITKQPTTDIWLKLESFVQLHYVTPQTNPSGGYNFIDNKIKSFKSADSSLTINTAQVHTGRLSVSIQPNCAAGYAFCDSQTITDYGVYCLGKNFDMRPYVNSTEVLQPNATSGGTFIGQTILRNHVMSDVAVMTSGGIYGGNQWMFKDGKAVSQDTYYLSPLDETGYRLIGDYRLHNARVFVFDNAVTEDGGRVSISQNTAVKIKAFIGNDFVGKATTYGQLLPSLAEAVASISQLQITKLSTAKQGTGFVNVEIGYTIRYKDANSNTWVEQKGDQTQNTQFVDKYIAIEDYDGNIGVIKT